MLCSSLLLGEPFVKHCSPYAIGPLSYLSVCLSVLSATMAYCGQMVGWIKMKLGVVVGLGPGHIVLDWDPAPSPQKRANSPCLLWPNGRPSQLLLSCCSVMKLWTSDRDNKPWLAFFDVLAAKYVLTRSICYSCYYGIRHWSIDASINDLEWPRRSLQLIKILLTPTPQKKYSTCLLRYVCPGIC